MLVPYVKVIFQGLCQNFSVSFHCILESDRHKTTIPANICWSWRRLEDVLKTCLEDVFNTSSAEQFYVFQDVLQRCFEDVLKTSWRPLATRLGRRKIVTLKTSWRHVLKTSWGHVLKMSWRHVLKMSWRHVLKTS